MIVSLGNKSITYPSLTWSAGLTLFTGPSGSGKTTLLRALHGELPITEASEHWSTLETALMPQQNTWIPYLSLRNQLREFGGRSAESLLKRLQLSEHADKRPNELSIGQLQRFSLALTLSKNAMTLLLDEPTSALDDDLAELVFELLKEHIEESDHRSIIAVTHDPRMRAYFTQANLWEL